MTAPLRAPFVFIMAALALAILSMSPTDARAEPAQIQAHPQLNADGIHVQPWIKYPEVLDMPKAATAAAENGKAMMVIYEQRGCSYCKRMHEGNFTHPVLVNYLVAHFDVYQLDMNSQKPVIAPDGRKMSQADLASFLRVTGTPTTLFFDSDAMEAFRLPGYLQTPHHYAALRYFVADVNGGSLSIDGFQIWVNANAEQIISELGG